VVVACHSQRISNWLLQSLRCHLIRHVCTSISAQYNMRKLSDFLFYMVETVVL
jgi:hypothetical protein